MFSGLAQSPMAQETITNKLKGSLEQFLEEKNGDLFMITGKGKSVFLKKFDAQSLMLKDEWEIEKFKVHNRRAEFSKATVSRKGFHLIFEAYSASNKKVYLVERLITRTGEIGEVREIASSQNVFYGAKIDMLFSEDKSRMAIVMPPSEGVAPEASMFDNDLNLLWKQSFENPFSDGDFTITQNEVSNSGDLLVVGYRDEGRFNKREIKPSEKYAVLRIDAKNRLSVYDLKGLRKTFHGLSVKADLLEGYVLTGFYGKDEKSRPQGVYFANLSTSTFKPVLEKLEDSESEHFSKLDQEFDFMGKLSTSKTNQGFASLRCKNFAELKNGNIAIIAERDYIYKVPGGYSYRYLEEIVVLCFNPKGQLLWVKVIPKMQQTQTDLGVASYIFHEGKDEIYLFYSADVGKVESIMEDLGAEYTFPGGYIGLIGVGIDEKGEVRMESLINAERDYYAVNTQTSFSPNSKVLFVSRVRYGANSFKLSRYSF